MFAKNITGQIIGQGPGTRVICNQRVLWTEEKKTQNGQNEHQVCMSMWLFCWLKFKKNESNQLLQGNWTRGANAGHSTSIHGVYLAFKTPGGSCGLCIALVGKPLCSQNVLFLSPNQKTAQCLRFRKANAYLKASLSLKTGFPAQESAGDTCDWPLTEGLLSALQECWSLFMIPISFLWKGNTNSGLLFINM